MPAAAGREEPGAGFKVNDAVSFKLRLRHLLAEGQSDLLKIRHCDVANARLLTHRTKMA
jgi:hypothetical protein